MDVDKVNNDVVSKDESIPVDVLKNKNVPVPRQNENCCNVCDSNFPSKEGLENHMKTIIFADIVLNHLKHREL